MFIGTPHYGSKVGKNAGRSHGWTGQREESDLHSQVSSENVAAGPIAVRILAAAYPSIGELFDGQGGARVLRRFFRFIAGYCTAANDAIHATSNINGVLESGTRIYTLPSIPASFWQKNSWLASNDLLAARPAVGGPTGIQPDSPNDRIMEAFGSNDYRDPFMAVDQQLNGPKGRIMGRRDATGIPRIRIQATAAVASDSQGDVDELLQMVRVGFSVFEYLNTVDAAQRWNMVRRQVRQQFTYIEVDLGVPNLADWWDLFSEDYFALVSQDAQDWAHRAINAAAAPFVEANSNGHNLNTYAQVLGALEEMLQAISGMHTPPEDAMSNP